MNIYNKVLLSCEKVLDKKAMILWREDGIKYQYSYSKMLDRINDFSSILEKIGITAGDRIVIAAESCPEWSIAYLSIAKMKATAVLVDASLPEKDILALIEKSDASAIYTSPELLNTIGIDINVPVLDIMSNGNLIDGCPTADAKKARIAGDENVAAIIYSSGTTKTASGIMQGHDAMIGSAIMCCNSNYIDGKDRFFGILPNSHIYGLYTQVIAPLILGTSVCFVEKLTPACLLNAMSGYRPTVFPAVPKVFDMLKMGIEQKINADDKTKKLFHLFFPLCLKLRKATGINLGKLLFKTIGDGFGGEMRVMASAGAPLDKQTAEFYYGVGFNILLTYGATETSIPTIGNYGKNITTDSCGKPYPEVKMKLDSNGEILIRSPYLMYGYFDDEAATAHAFTQDGWFKTGDIGELNKKNNICIVGRLKDNIVLPSGKKVAPDDVEKAYAGIRGVKEFVICGIPDNEGCHDTIHAFIVADSENESEALKEIKTKSTSLPQNLKLSGIHFISDIPKTSLQKPKRFLLQKYIQDTYNNKETACESKPENKGISTHDFIMGAVAKAAGVDISEIIPDTRIFEELPIDSLSAISLSLEIEEFCGKSIFECLKHSMTVSELIGAASNDEKETGRIMVTDDYPRRKKIFDYARFNIYRKIIKSIYNVNIDNDLALPENSGYIICANHVTNFDCLLLSLTFKKDRFMKFSCMAKQELFKKKLSNKRFIQTFGLIPVDRGGNATSGIKLAKQKLMDKWGVLIHPEGTRSRSGEMGEFKRGAALLAIESGVPIYPAYISGGHEVYPPSQKLPKLFNWKKLKKFDIQVIYGEPIFPQGLSIEDLMEKVNLTIKSLAVKCQFSNVI